MIFRIDKSITELNAPDLLVFAGALQKASENLHFLDVDYQVQLWIERTIFQSDLYLGKLVIQQIQRNEEMWSPSSMNRKYLRTVTVGCEEGMLTASSMKIMAEEPSVVVLENGKYDWCVISKWIKLYRKDHSFGYVNAYVNRAVGCNLIRSGNAGGSGGILNEIDILIPSYKDTYPLKLLSIFDSDKTSPTDIEEHNNTIKEGLNKLGIEYHELCKREIENYFPLDTYRRAGFVVAGVDVPDLPEEEWDYLDVHKNDFLSLEKKDVETLAKEITKPELQSRVGNVNGQDEIQEIILKLARHI